MRQPPFFLPHWGWFATVTAMIVAPANTAHGQLTEQQKRALSHLCSAAEINAISRLQADQAAHGIDLGAALKVGGSLRAPCSNAWAPRKQPVPCTPQQMQRLIVHDGMIQYPNKPLLDCRNF